MLSVIVSTIVILGLMALFSFIGMVLRRRTNTKARKEHTYEEISSRWELWDKFVNCYYGLDKDDNPIPNDMKARYIERTDFGRISIEEKNQMLIAEFGEEAKHH